MVHHVFNRSLGRRAVFVDAETVAYFESCVEKQVRRGLIEVEASVFLPTHFHLIVRSLVGRLSQAMQQIESEFVRWFNERHGRDGPLFRSRFRSKPVGDEHYRAILQRYVDHNPVEAGIVSQPEDYPYGSAAAFVLGPTPRWLSRRWIDEELGWFVERGMTFAEAYRYRFGAPSEDEDFLVERRLEGDYDEDLSDLVAAAPARVRQWMIERVAVADGTRLRGPIVGPQALGGAIADARSERGSLPIARQRQDLDGWQILEIALLRDLCAMRQAEIAARLGMPRSTLRHRVTQIPGILEAHPGLRQLAASIGASALESAKGPQRV